MKNQINLISCQGKKVNEIPKKDTDLTIHGKKNQKESKYDSHSEQMPHQTTIVNDGQKQDRSSNDNRDNYKASKLNEKES
jgi:hypothetical protein